MMKMAGETGLLLRIEKEIENKVSEIARGLKEEAKNAQTKLGDTGEQKQLALEAARYASKGYQKEFLTQAETKVLQILKQLSEEAYNGDAWQKLLFADDSSRGFAFIELCRIQYDIVLMNPPFGAASISSEIYINQNYPNWSGNILTAFFSRMLELITTDGLVGSIYDRTVAIKSSYEGFRKECFCGHITSMADTGWNVLEANVETTTSVIKKAKNSAIGCFIDVQLSDDKAQDLTRQISNFTKNIKSKVYQKISLDFEKLPNSVIGYHWDDYLIKLFAEQRSLSEIGLQVREGHSLVSDQHFRVYFEVIDTKNFCHFFNGGLHSFFYFPYRDLTKFGIDGYLVSSHYSTILRNKNYQQKFGIGYGKRGEILDSQVVKSDMIFGVEGKTISDISQEISFKGLSFLNSIYSQYIINLFCGQHKQAGYVNLLPVPDASPDISIIKQAIQIKRKWFSIDETALEFHHLLSHFLQSDSIKNQIDIIQNEVLANKKVYLNLINVNDLFWMEAAAVPNESRIVYEEFKKKRPKENLISIDGITDETIVGNPNIAYEIISNLLGVAYGRWDLRSIRDPLLIPDFGDFFDPLPYMPIVALKKRPDNYPILFPEDGILVQDFHHENNITRAIEKVVYEIWGANGNNFINELSDIGKYSSLDDFLSMPNGFFDFHYTRYTKSRREAPIYWPLSTPSGSYTVWVYYPKLNDQTIFKIISNYLIPKEEALEVEIREGQNNTSLDNKGLKELQVKIVFLNELQYFHTELLRVANLPYRPVHEDGVLICAAPLFKLVRHTKWRKSTEDCWKALEKGEYDWTHMAYSIWPDSIRKKCANDLSMAIAHGLEDICNIKPKEKKEKKKKEAKEIVNDNPLNL